MKIGGRYTVYDVMEARGFFNTPANRDAYDRATGQTLFQGPIEYPKMFYHPNGAERVVVPEIVIDTPLGPRVETREQKEIVWQMAHTEDQEKALRENGWHDHPAKAMSAAGKIAPPMSSENRIADLEALAKRLQKEIDEGKELAAANAKLVEANAGKKFDKTGFPTKNSL